MRRCDWAWPCRTRRPTAVPSPVPRLSPDRALAVMRRLWRGEKVGGAQLNPWPAALGGPKLLIGSWAGSRWIPRAAKDFDGWIGSGARSSVAALCDGIKRFREAGGIRAIATN